MDLLQKSPDVEELEGDHGVELQQKSETHGRKPEFGQVLSIQQKRLPVPMILLPAPSATPKQKKKSPSRLPLMFPLFKINPNPYDPFMDHRIYSATGWSRASSGTVGAEPSETTCSSLSSTVESFSGPRKPSARVAKFAGLMKRYYPRTPPEVAEDFHSGCNSSSSMVDDRDRNRNGDGVGARRDRAACSSSFLYRNKPLPFDLNFPPLDQADYGDVACFGDDLQCITLCI